MFPAYLPALALLKGSFVVCEPDACGFCRKRKFMPAVIPVIRFHDKAGKLNFHITIGLFNLLLTGDFYINFIQSVCRERNRVFVSQLVTCFLPVKKFKPGFDFNEKHLISKGSGENKEITNV